MTSVQDHVFVLPVLSNSPENQPEGKYLPRRECGSAASTHQGHDFFFFNAKGKKKKKKITHIFYLAWAILQSMETHSHSQDWHMCTVRHKKPCCSDLISSNLVSFSRKKKKKTVHREGQKMGWSNQEETLKLLNPQQLALFFLDPNCQGINTICFFF